MPHSQGFTAVSGSHRDPLEGAERLGPVDPNSEVTVSVLLRRGGSHDAAAHLAQLAETPPAQREHVAPEDFAARYGASPEDLAKVSAFAERAGLTVLDSSAERRTVVLRGTAQDMSKAFDVELAEYEHPQLGRYRGRTDTVAVPQELGEVVKAVVGLDNRQVAQPRFVLAAADASAGTGASATEGSSAGTRASATEGSSAGTRASATEGSSTDADGSAEAPARVSIPAAAAPAAAVPFTPPQVAALYDFPDGAAAGAGAGQGECIALIELGGGYHSADLHHYFHSLGVHAPKVVHIGVDGATNAPGSEADIEVVLDIEVPGSIADHAKIAVYFAPNTTQGFIDAITTAIHDTTHKPSVMSISWGAPENGWTEQSMDAMEQAFADAALLGVTVCIAAGDHGAGDGESDGLAHADFPASALHVLGCGGTHLEANGGAIALENVWNEGNGWAGGGGVSDHFALPPWQAAANVSPSVNPGGHVGRGVPDVAGNADSTTGYRIHVNGEDTVVGGTSAVAPLWAALTAILNQRLGHRVGFLNPALYGLASPHTCFHDILSGKNEVPGAPGYSAHAGWDACTGLGTPAGGGLLAAL